MHRLKHDSNLISSECVYKAINNVTVQVNVNLMDRDDILMCGQVFALKKRKTFENVLQNEFIDFVLKTYFRSILSQ